MKLKVKSIISHCTLQNRFVILIIQNYFYISFHPVSDFNCPTLPPLDNSYVTSYDVLSPDQWIVLNCRTGHTYDDGDVTRVFTCETHVWSPQFTDCQRKTHHCYSFFFFSFFHYICIDIFRNGMHHAHNSSQLHISIASLLQ